MNLLTAAIVPWNTVYLDRTIATLTSNGSDINLTGHYTWPRTNDIKAGDTGHYGGRQNLSVGYFTFSQTTPGPPC